MPESPSWGSVGDPCGGQTPERWGRVGLYPQQIGEDRVQSTCLGKAREQVIMG